MSDKRQLILSAASALLASKGFHGFSMKQLAAEAGVAAGTVYLYFKDKNALIEQLHDDISANVVTHMLADHDPTAPLFDQYRGFYVHLWNYCLANPDAVLSKNQFDQLPADIREAQHNRILQRFAAVSAFFAAGRNSGELKPLPDEVLGSLSIESCTLVARKQLLGLVAVDQALLERLVAASYEAIAAQPKK